MINKLPKKFQGLVKEVDFLGKGKGYIDISENKITLLEKVGE